MKSLNIRIFWIITLMIEYFILISFYNDYTGTLLFVVVTLILIITFLPINKNDPEQKKLRAMDIMKIKAAVYDRAEYDIDG